MRKMSLVKLKKTVQSINLTSNGEQDTSARHQVEMTQFPCSSRFRRSTVIQCCKVRFSHWTDRPIYSMNNAVGFIGP